MSTPSNNTVRAPLFSEQVALLAQLDEASARQLKKALDRAQPGESAAKNAAPTLRSAGLATGLLGLCGAASSALMSSASSSVLVLGSLALIALGFVLLLLAVQAEAQHGAVLIRALAQAIAKRRKEAPQASAPSPLK